MGVLADAVIERMAREGAIRGGDLHVQPASLDLTLSDLCYRLRASFLPGPGRAVEGKAKSVGANRMDLSGGAVLEPGAVYLVKARESFALPKDVSGRANPKSSTGRVDVFVRVLCDATSRFDEIEAGYAGGLWIEVIPLTFPVAVREGTRLAQVRFRREGAPLDDRALEALHARDPLVVGSLPLIRDGLCLTVDLAPDANGVSGWRACRYAGVVDMDVCGRLDASTYWEPVRSRACPDGRHGMVLDPGEFYILASRESVRVPVTHAAEMVPFDAGVGEFRAHYAGFFDCGFGTGEPSRAVLEVRSHQAPFLLEDGQVVGKLAYEAMESVPLRPYGSAIASNYDGQRLRLSKHFS